jgi:hypothetical protein
LQDTPKFAQIGLSGLKSGNPDSTHVQKPHGTDRIQNVVLRLLHVFVRVQAVDRNDAEYHDVEKNDKNKTQIVLIPSFRTVTLLNFI